jgi:hypothetical protein
VKTLGIDLATEDHVTGVCLVDWSASPPCVETVETGTAKTGMDDDALADQVRAVVDDGGWAAIDAPFGFPQAFTDAGTDRYWQGSGISSTPWVLTSQ